jgi:hypothetical protein
MSLVAGMLGEVVEAVEEEKEGETQNGLAGDVVVGQTGFS